MADSKLTKSLKDNVNMFKRFFANDQTIIFRHFTCREIDELKCCVIYIDSMADKNIINESIILPIFNCTMHIKTLEILIEKVICTGNVVKTSNINESLKSIMYGYPVLLVEGFDEVLLIKETGWSTRAISEPINEKVLLGSREGFTESLNTNLSLIRRRVLSEKLKFQFKEIGTLTKTKVCICYIEGLASTKILKELDERLNKINIDGILDSGYIQESIKDCPLSPLKTIGNTERPDVVVGKLLEGRIALICDGTPNVLTLPYIFIEYFHVSEDYYKNYVFATINRLLRIIGIFLSSSVPALYTALTTLHKEMIPSPLLLSISAARNGLPFPTVVEAIIMLLIFEIIREAGTRLPTVTGQAISIVGALVLGEAAVSARFISAPMVIIVALSGITSFLIPGMIEILVIARLAFLISSGVLGLYGYIFVVTAFFIHLMSIRSFGVPYMTNTSPITPQDIKDTAIRAPWLYMHYRSKLATGKNRMLKSNPDRKERIQSE